MLFNVPVVYMGREGRNDCDAGKSISKAIGRGGGGLKIETFWALKGQRAKRVPFGSKKLPTLLK